MSSANRRTRILLIERDPTVQHLRALMLRMKGYEVTGSASLEDARVRLEEKHYQLLIIDVGHFAAPGIKFCEQMKQRHPRLKVLMQAEDSAIPPRETCPDRVIAKQDGPHHFITEVERLLAKV